MTLPVTPTARQADALRFIHGYQLAHGGVSPSFSEIRDALGLAAKSCVFRLLDGLVERGHIRRRACRQRAIEVLVPPAIPLAPDGAPLFAVPFLTRQGFADG